MASEEGELPSIPPLRVVGASTVVGDEVCKVF
jgi:hypothetical protein